MTTDNIARADEIVGLTKDGDWPNNFISEYVDDVRRGRYTRWMQREA